MIKLIINYWNFITEFGVSDKHIHGNDLIRGYNQMSHISVIIAIVVAFVGNYLGMDSNYLWCVCGAAGVYSVVLFLNYFHRIMAARYFAAIVAPIWSNGIYLLIGGYFAQGVVALTSIVFTVISFRKMALARNVLIAYILLFYFSVAFYVPHYGPILGLYDLPYDEVAVSVACLGWLSAVVIAYQRDRLRIYSQLSLRKEELEESSEELERFAYLASHDLKTPLRTIVSFVQLAEKSIKRNDSTLLRGHLDYIKTGVEQMTDLVLDLNQLTQVDNGLAQERGYIDLNEIVDQVRLEMKEELMSTGGKILSRELPIAYGSFPDYLTIFKHIVENAIKFNTSAVPEVEISFNYSNNNELFLAFKDNGIGVSSEFHEQIFRHFKKLHSGGMYKGTGLGLALCRKLLRRIGGDISIVSNKGSGSTITILIPNEKVVKYRDILSSYEFLPLDGTEVSI